MSYVIWKIGWCWRRYVRFELEKWRFRRALGRFDRRLATVIREKYGAKQAREYLRGKRADTLNRVLHVSALVFFAMNIGLWMALICSIFFS